MRTPTLLGSLAELATTSVDRLKGKHLEAEDFDKLFSDDPAKDLLVWLSEPEAVKSGWNSGRWSAFKSRCNSSHVAPNPARRCKCTTRRRFQGIRAEGA